MNPESEQPTGQVQFNTEIPADLHRALRLRAVETGQTVKDLTRQLLAEGLCKANGNDSVNAEPVERRA